MNNDRREFLKAGGLLALTPAVALARRAPESISTDATVPAPRAPGSGQGSIPGPDAQVNGVRYHVGDQGRGDAVLLLHGMPDTSAVWRHQVLALVRAGYRVIVPDMLGYGETDKPQDPQRYAGDKILADLLALLDVFDLPKVDVIGHDWGAVASWELVLNFPERFRRHVALSVGHPDAIFNTPTIEELKTSWYMYFNTQAGAPEFYATNDGGYLREFLLPTHPEFAEVWSRMQDPVAMNGMLNWDRGNPMSTLYVAAARGQVERRNCNVPTLGLWSSGDTYLWETQMQRSEQSMAATWRYERIERASHWLMLEQPDLVNTSILDWLRLS